MRRQSFLTYGSLVLVILGTCVESFAQSAPAKRPVANPAENPDIFENVQRNPPAQVTPLGGITKPRPLPAPRSHGPYCGDVGQRPLDQIQLHLNRNGINWYFNGFFNGHSHAALYEQYFPNRVLPSARTPRSIQPPQHVPGNVPSEPTAALLDDVLLSLSCIEYSSRYGGTIQLTFQMAEDYEYEARKGSTLWDIDGLELRLFVVPNAAAINTRNLGIIRTHVEILPGPARAYTIDPSGSIGMPSDAAGPELPRILRAVAERVRESSRDISAFAHGFIHEQRRDQLSASDKVSMIEIGDEYLQLATSRKTWFISIETSATDLRSDGLMAHAYLCISHRNKEGHEIDKVCDVRMLMRGTVTKPVRLAIKLDECHPENSIMSDFQFTAFKPAAVIFALNCKDLRDKALPENDGTVVASMSNSETEFLEQREQIVGTFDWMTQVRMYQR